MLVGEQEGDGGDAEPAGWVEGEERAEPEEQNEHGKMHGAGGPEGGRDADGLGQGVETGGAVVFAVLAGVEDVESAGPEGDGGGEHKDAGVERAADGDPGGGGSQAEGESEAEVGPAGEAFEVAVAKEDGEDEGRQVEGEAIQIVSSDEEDHDSKDGGTEDGPARELAGGDGAVAGAGVGGVKVSVGPAVEGHGGGSGGDHGEDDPGEGAPGGQAVGCEQGGGEGKGEGEDGVLPLDHFERDAGFGKQAGHGWGSIV